MLKELDGYQHPRTSGARVTSAPLLDDGWMDFAAYGNTDEQIGAIEHQLYGVPFVNLDCGREDSGAGKSAAGDVDTAAFRKRLWNATMNGQSVTYANTGTGAQYANSPGAKQMTVWYDFFFNETRYWELEPYYDVDGGRALALEDTEYVVYMEKPGPLELIVEKHGYDVYWVNPIDGQFTKGKFKGDHFTGSPPDNVARLDAARGARGPRGRHEQVLQVRIARDRAAGSGVEQPQGAVHDRAARGRHQRPGLAAVRRQTDQGDARHARHDVVVDGRGLGRRPGLPRARHRAEGRDASAGRHRQELSRADAPAPVRYERQREGVRGGPRVRTQSVMPLTLAVDTTSEYGSLALLRDGDLLEEALLHAPDSFSPVLYEELRRLLERHALKVADIDCFAAASGPGTFTGVRVALACVKGLAEAMGRPAVAVSNLQAVARYGTGAAARRGVGCAPRRSLRGGLRCRRVTWSCRSCGEADAVAGIAARRGRRVFVERSFAGFGRDAIRGRAHRDRAARARRPRSHGLPPIAWLAGKPATRRVWTRTTCGARMRSWR